MPPRKSLNKSGKPDVVLDYSIDSLVGESFALKTSTDGNIRIDKKQLHHMIRNPQSNYDKLQKISRLLRETNGIYNNIIDYFKNLPTFDHTIIPVSNPSSYKNNPDKINQSFFEAAMFLDGMRVKTTLRMFLEEILTCGEAYYIIITDKNGMLFKKVKSSYCQIYKNDAGVLRFAINMNSFRNEDITEYPLFLQQAMDVFIKNPESSLFVAKKYYLLEENGVAFSVKKDGTHAIPVFANIFKDIISLDEKKELADHNDRINSSIFLHNQIPIGSNDLPVLDPQVSQKYQSAMKQSLQAKGLDMVFSLTNPFDVSSIKLSNDTDKTKNMVADAKDNIYDGAGVSIELFNADKSATAQKNATIVDSSSMKPYIDMFSDFIDSVLAKKKIKGITWKIKLYETTDFDKDNARTESKADLAYGGSVLGYFAQSHYTPLEMATILEMESAMDIKSKLTPVQTSHTQSASDSSSSESSSGKTSAEEILDSGEAINESTEANLNSGE